MGDHILCAYYHVGHKQWYELLEFVGKQIEKYFYIVREKYTRRYCLKRFIISEGIQVPGNFFPKLIKIPEGIS